MKIESCSVRVLRSFDYCHFEISLSATLDSDNLLEVDDLRKRAARLADKAVEQYKIAKANAELALNDKQKAENLRYRHRDILEKTEGERTPEEKAIVKAIEDREHWKRRTYDYEDDFEEEDYHGDALVEESDLF